MGSIGQNKQENAYWSAWNELHQKIGYQFYLLFEAVEEAMKETPTSRKDKYGVQSSMN